MKLEHFVSLQIPFLSNSRQNYFIQLFYSSINMSFYLYARTFQYMSLSSHSIVLVSINQVTKKSRVISHLPAWWYSPDGHSASPSESRRSKWPSVLRSSPLRWSGDVQGIRAPNPPDGRRRVQDETAPLSEALKKAFCRFPRANYN